MLQKIIDSFLEELRWRLDWAKKYPDLTDTYPREAITAVIARITELSPHIHNLSDAVHAMLFVVGLWGSDPVSKEIANELLQMDEYFLADQGGQDKLFVSLCSWERIEDPRFSLTTLQILKNIMKCEIILLESALDGLEGAVDEWVRMQ